MNRKHTLYSLAAATGLCCAALICCSGNSASATGSTGTHAAQKTTPPATASAPVLRYDSLSFRAVTFHWAAAQGRLHCRLSAPTTGWISVGFNPTQMKKDSDLIIGYVKNGTVHIQDNFGVNLIGHQSDVSLGGKDDVTNASGFEAQGRTEIGFTIPLDSGDKFDRPLAVGKKYPVILAYAPNGADNFTSMHQLAFDTTITLR